MKYKEFFADPQCFSDGSIVLSFDYTKEQAHEIMESWHGSPIPIEAINQEYVRFSWPPDYLLGEFEVKHHIWWLGATGKGIKPVWVYSR